MVGRLKVLHLPYELFSHHTPSEAILLTLARDRGMITLFVMLEVSAIDYT
jgi:hypothetical protein